MPRNAIAPFVAGLLFALGGSAHAATATATFNVTASVANNCTVSAANLGFGTFTASADVTNSSTVTMNCTNGTPYTVTLSTGSSGVFATRTMKSGTNLLNYNLYKDAGLTTIWGDGTSSTATNAGTGSGLSSAHQVTYTVYGKLPMTGNQDAPVGSYTDSITVSVNY
ncbi:MAG TPA: spore coat U domain-containing protein [Steroidobacteraceae bacterium]|nr:spore coat U domain-containing protein [Steroidobacteraceae bacterium]